VIAPGRLARLVAGDFAERTRTYAFLVTLGLTVWAATVFVPTPGAGYSTVDIHGHRGAYNSAWIGAQLTLLVNAFLGLAGFYLVKSAIDRDRRTRVGQLLAATPLSRVGYTLAKALSNLAVLASMVGVVVVCSVALQWVRGEDARIDMVALALPHVLITLPFLALVAAMAVLFEALPVLRGGIGNVAWFFVWSFGLAAISGVRRAHESFGDPMGMGTVVPGMVSAARRAFPAENITGEHLSIGIQIGGNQGRPLVPFAYDGIDWTPELVGWRLLWFGVALAIAAAAALPFDRFANEGLGAGSPRRGRAKGTSDPVEGGVAPPANSPAADAPFDFARLAGDAPRRRFDLATLARAEIVVALKGFPRAWYLVALGLMIAALAAPLEAVKIGIGPALAIWPMLIWSALGARELRHGTSDLFLSAPRPLSRQLSATWLGGVTIGVALSGTCALRLALAGDAAGAITCLVGIAFVPALALACGVLTGNSRLFEALYFFLWYAAALNHVPTLDFTGAMAARTGLGVAAGYALATAALLAVAWTARRHQLAR
jgi:hypothetical protein